MNESRVLEEDRDKEEEERSLEVQWQSAVANSSSGKRKEKFLRYSGHARPYFIGTLCDLLWKGYLGPLKTKNTLPGFVLSVSKFPTR